jgi:hypothetical protein
VLVLRLHPVPLGDVPDDPESLEEAAALVEDRVRRHEDAKRAILRVAKRGLELDGLAGEAAKERVLGDGHRLRRNELAERTADDGRRGEAEHVGHRLVDLERLAFGIGAPKAFGGVVDEGAEAVGFAGLAGTKNPSGSAKAKHEPRGRGQGQCRQDDEERCGGHRDLTRAEGGGAPGASLLRLQPTASRPPAQP